MLKLKSSTNRISSKNSACFTVLVIFIIVFSIHVESTKCEWVGFNSGQTPACDTGWYVSGICGSRSTPACKETGLKSYNFMMQCCQKTYNNSPRKNCETVFSNADLNTCPSFQNSGEILALYGACESNGSKSCKSGSKWNAEKFYTSATCCESGDLTLQEKGCGWHLGPFGTLQSCPSGYAGAGVCGAGSKSGICKTEFGKADQGIYCCPFVENESPVTSPPETVEPETVVPGDFDWYLNPDGSLKHLYQCWH